ncbi:hypothetical protein GCM10009565_06760 [Amycolatopsis albidoflavus]
MRCLTAIDTVLRMLPGRRWMVPLARFGALSLDVGRLGLISLVTSAGLVVVAGIWAGTRQVDVLTRLVLAR